MDKPTRREFLKGIFVTGATAGLPAFAGARAFAQEDEKKKKDDEEEKKEDEKEEEQEKKEEEEKTEEETEEEKKKREEEEKRNRTVAVVKDNNPAKAVKKAIDILGGIKKFVKKGDVVVVKPNIGWDRKPEFAACTNPLVVAAIVKLCKKAGAKTIKVFDRTCNNARMCYASSGIKAAAEKEGAKVFYVDSRGQKGFTNTKFPDAKKLLQWPIFQEALDADVLINVPIAKHHGTTKLTFCMKNLMGICGDKRGKIHTDINEKLPDLATLIKPQLNILDAYRILWASGPRGGKTQYVTKKKTIVAGINMTTVDAYATQLFRGLGSFSKDLEPKDIPHIKIAGERNLGETDLSKIIVKKK